MKQRTKTNTDRTRRGLALLLAAIMILALTACGDSADGNEPAGDGNSDAAITIGLIQLIDNGAFDDMREGFVDQLRARGYTEEQVAISYKNAQGDTANLNALCQEMVDKKVDMVVTIGTPATQAMVNLESDIPVIFVSVGNPTGAGVITDMDAPDKNATGTSNAIPIENIFGLSDLLTPEVGSFGLLYCTSEVNSVTTIENAKAYMDTNDIDYVDSVVTNSSEVQQAAQNLADRVDAIFVPNDSVIQAAMDLVTEIARDAKIPVYGSSAVMVDSGAFATVAISDREIGAISADMAIRHLEGDAIENIPAIVVPAEDMVINRTTADILDITFSDEIEATAVFID